MTILVTNDDGLTDGLKILIEAAIRLDNHVYAIIPTQQKSAFAKGVTLHKILRLRKIDEEKFPIYELSGNPADCVCFGIRSGEFKKPNLVLSGINISENLSFYSIYSSGTIGACIEAALYGIPAIAFSLERNATKKLKDSCSEAKTNKNALKESIIRIIKKLHGKIQPYTIINVNFPENFNNAEIVFPKPAVFQSNSNVEKRLDPYDNPYYWHYLKTKECEKASDVYEFYVNRCITITPLSVLKIVDKAILNKLKNSVKE
ncbi:MAG: 5'/3'-nucleotidase SurE [Candidatus Micrarchaeota archaeon]